LKYFIKNAADLFSEELSKNQLKLRKIGIESLELAIHAVKPINLMKNSVKIRKGTLITEYERFNLDEYKKIYIIGGGKATAEMLEHIEKLFSASPNIDYVGIINIPEGLKLDYSKFSQKVNINFASHPVPDENGLKGTRKMMELVQKATKNDLIICLISGGGSALLPLPKKGISLRDLQKMNTILISSGASINEINTVRKHVSDFKGGNLAKTVNQSSKAKILSLIISDVVGNDYSIIASGPTVPDHSTFSDTMEIVKKFALYDKLPHSIVEVLEKGLKGEIEENPILTDPCFENLSIVLVGSSKAALKEVGRTIIKYGFNGIIFNSRIIGEAKEFGRDLYSQINELIERYKRDKEYKKRMCLIGTGELTVTIKGMGIGGRNQEMLLSFLDTVKNEDIDYEFLIIGANLDGIEGNSKAMGGLIDNFTLSQIVEKNLDPLSYLEQNDSNSFFKEVQGEIITGPTGTNVNDLVIILIEK